MGNLELMDWARLMDQSLMDPPISTSSVLGLQTQATVSGFFDVRSELRVSCLNGRHFTD